MDTAYSLKPSIQEKIMHKVLFICLVLLSLASQGMAAEKFSYDFDPSDQKKEAVSQLYHLIAIQHELQVLLHTPSSFEKLCEIDAMLRKNELEISRAMKRTKAKVAQQQMIAAK